MPWSLTRVLGLAGTDEFFAECWEKRPFRGTRRDPRSFSGLLTIEDIDRLLGSRLLPERALRVVQADQAVERGQFVEADGQIDLIRVYQLFGDGATLVLNGLHRHHQPLAELCRALELELGIPVQANAYLTPPNSQGFKPHFDTHDVLVLQVGGSKHWRVGGVPVTLPFRGQSFAEEDHEEEEIGKAGEEFFLEAGDAAYLPRGWVHSAAAGKEISLHVTVGLLSRTWAEFLVEALAAVCLDDVEFRRGLPPGLLLGVGDQERLRAREIFFGLWDRARERLDFEGTREEFAGQFRERGPAPAAGQLVQILRARTLDFSSLVGARPGCLTECFVAGDGFVVRHAQREVRFPGFCRQSVEYALSSPRFSVDQIPGPLDAEGRLTLVRRLIREGLLIALAGE